MPHPARFERVTAAFGEPNHWRLVGNAEMVSRKYRVFVSCGCGTNSVGISCTSPCGGLSALCRSKPQMTIRVVAQPRALTGRPHRALGLSGEYLTGWPLRGRELTAKNHA